MNNDDIHGLAGAYAVDAVDDVERARFDAHLTGCSQCQTEVASLRGAAGELSATTVTTPPTSLRASVLRDISSVRPLPPELTSGQTPAPERVSSSIPSTPTSAPSAVPTLESTRAERARRAPRRQWLAGAAAAAVLATGGLVWQPWATESNTVQLTATQRVLQARDAQRFEQKVGTATTTVVRAPSLNKAVMVTANLPSAPAGKVYQLWLQQGATMVKAGFVPAGPSSTVLLQGNAITATGAGITVEPAGGSERPTTPPVALITFA